MSDACEAADQARNLEVITWSGTRSTKKCHLNDPNDPDTRANHWVSIKSWKTIPVDVALEATISQSLNPMVEFDSPGATGVTNNHWEEKDITIPPKQGGWRGQPGIKDLGYVSLKPTGLPGSDNVFVELEANWYPGEKHTFSLAIRVDT